MRSDHLARGLTGAVISIAVFHTVASPVFAQPFAPRDSSGPFINWESPHVHPLAMTPDGQRLLAVNTADNRLEVFSLATGVPVHVGNVPVGLDPVTVRARTNTEAWVVNHISDSVSIVNLTAMNVVATLKTADEPCDVAFAGPGLSRAFVSCASVNRVLVFDAGNPAAAPTTLDILGERPRALAVSPSGTHVYAAIFESGNRSTILAGGATGTNLGFPPNVVTNAAGPYGGVNPPPNAGAAFDPPIAPQNRTPNPNPPAVGLIVKKNATGRWMDDNNGDWTNLVSGPQAGLSGRPVGWDLYDHDVAVIEASSLDVTYATGLMNICMNLAVNPSNGEVTVVGTDATNEVRFEPVVNGKFLRVQFAAVNPVTLGGAVTDLNPHLSYAVANIPQTNRDQSLGDPRALIWNSTGTQGFVAGMGSNNIAFIGPTGDRAATDVLDVGQAPTGLALDATGSTLYVLNRFDATISTVNTAARSIVGTTPFYDPTPVAIKVGRKHLYDTHKNSGLGHIACASCHVDARMDRLAWDLGDPAGAPIAVSTATRNLGQNLIGLNSGFQPYHPMKGPMTTQTMQDIIGKEPHHWRGDRLGLEEFNPAFPGLQGDDAGLTTQEMQEFEDFLATITFPPNPFRSIENTLPTNLPLPGHYTTGRFAPAGNPLPNGDAIRGLAAYRSASMRLDGGAFACVTCHTLPTGAGTDMRLNGATTLPYVAIAPGPKGERHLSLVSVDGSTNVTMKVPQTRNEYLKRGFNMTQVRNTAGFGVLHDGSIDSIERFVSEPVFNVTSDQMVADLTALMLAFSGSNMPAGSTTNFLEPPGPPSRDSHAAVGVQTTAGAAVDTTLINTMITLAGTGKVGVVARGLVAGEQRGFVYIAGTWRSDRAGETYSTAQLTALATPGGEITFTVVPSGSETRIGIDRDLDGFYNADELTVCTDPANPASRPGTQQSVDFNGDLSISVQDLFDFLTAYFTGAADFNADGFTTVQDIFDYLTGWFSCGG
jgi:DNA-binding beta-propeller fold protein YncE